MRIKTIQVALRSFLNDTRGTATVESLIGLPLLIFWLTATFVFFDAYKTLNTQEKASGAVADMIARQQEGVDLTPEYLTGINSIFKFMISDTGDANIRVTSVTYDADDDKFISLWSHSTGAHEPISTNDLNITYKHRLPELEDGESYIVVETFVDYSPAFNVGINAQERRTWAPTPLRFASRIQCPDCDIGS